MIDGKQRPEESTRMRQLALSRWENEGGMLPAGKAVSEVPELTNAELVQLRIRVIALENLIIALLTNAPDHQLDIVREMASYISPRPGFTHHPLTLHAADQMIDLVERAAHFRDIHPQ